MTKADSLSGNVVGLAGQLPQIKSSIKMKYELFKEIYSEKGTQRVESIKTTELLMLSVNTTITVGNVTRITPKEAELNLRIPVCSFEGDKTGIARNIKGHWRLIGWGEIV